MKFLTFILFIITFSTEAIAQGEIDEQNKIFYRNERTFGILLNTNGYGVNYRYAKRIDATRKNLYVIEFNYLKHNKEIKSTTYYNKTLVFGKLNTTYTLKGGIGYQKEMFQKRDQGGISIRYFISLGPTFAIMKPVYYEIENGINQSSYYSKFDPHLSPTQYIGRAPFSEGFSELKVQPGLFCKYGFTFEYSRDDEIFHALELGTAIDAYAGEVPIMYKKTEQENASILPDNHFFLTLFISYRFGKIINTQFNTKRNKIDKFVAD